ncbi:MAG TPA: hypothetical protein VN345_19215 [Blastocatellia bacterium]|nr:hypothetical protein [Blastocatellia bacterium]
MTRHQIRKARNRYDDGHPDHRLTAAEEAYVVIVQDVGRLQASVENQRHEFRRMLEAWLGIRIKETRPPHAIHEDVHTAWNVSFFACLLVIAELVLSYFLATIFAIPIVFAMMIALVAIAATEIGLHALWLNKQRPRENIRRLRRYIIAPALVVTLGALCLLFLARSLSQMFPDEVINISLFALSVGTLLLAAGLLGFAHVYFWSRRAERIYNRTERELALTASERRHVEKIMAACKDEDEAGPPAPGTQTTKSLPSAKTAPNALAATIEHTAPAILLALLALLPLSSASCAFKTSANPPSNEAGKPVQQTFLDVYMDWSLSPESQPFESSVERFTKQAPEIVADLQVKRLSAYQFSTDGWSAREILAMDFPLPRQAPGDEASQLFGRKKAAKQEEADTKYREGIKQRLSSISKPDLLPPQSLPEPRCTDINGVIARILSSAGDARRIAIIFTDGHESCATRLSSRPAPSTQSCTVLFVLLPEAPGRKETRSVQFEDRSARIHSALPWAYVIAPHADLLKAISEAVGTNGTVAHSR